MLWQALALAGLALAAIWIVAILAVAYLFLAHGRAYDDDPDDWI